MKNKILIAIFTILTFGIFLIPRTFAYSVSQLDNVNRVVDYGTFGTGTSPTIYYSHDSNMGVSVYLCIQCFSTTDLNTPINMNALGITPMYYPGAWTNMTIYTTNQNYGYRTGSFIIESNYSYIVLSGIPSNFQLENYVFNICIVKTYQTGFIGHFVPNTFYNIDEGQNGVFYNASAFLSLDGSSSLTDVSNYMISYNNIRLSQYVNSIYSSNSRDTYQYHLYIKFENGIALRNLPNLRIKFLELEYININGTLMSYSLAKQNYTWLYNNIVLYNNNATLYTSEDAINGSQQNIIYEMRFRLPDYQFMSSSYYDSTLGLKGYLNGVLISTFDYTTFTAYEMGYIDGFNLAESQNYDSAYNDGYQAGTKVPRSSLDTTIFAVADTPLTIIDGFLNFEILGTNIKSFVFAIVSLMLFVYLFRKFKE